MDNIILDLDSDVNVIPRQTWDMMVQPKLILSPIQLILVNQHNIIPVRRLTWVNVNIDIVHSVANFKLIDIVDGSTPYIALLGLAWEFDNQMIFTLNKKYMVF
jgi:hypothetical protein